MSVSISIYQCPSFFCLHLCISLFLSVSLFILLSLSLSLSLSLVSEPHGNTSHLEVQRGQSLRLLCTANSQPPATLSWSLEHRVLSWSSPVGSRTLALELPRMKAGDSGRYICRAENRLGFQQHSLDLSVLYPPEDLRVTVSQANRTVLEILRNGTSFPVLEGQSLCLVCVTHSNPPATLSWTGVAQTLLPSQSSEPGVLELPLVQREHEGEFTCAAQSPLGAQRISLSLSVHYPPQMPRSSCSWEAEGLHCNCSSRAWPAPTLHWRLGEGLLEGNSSNVSFTVTSSSTGPWVNSSLSLRGELWPNLWLSCEAWNTHGTQRASVLLLPDKESSTAFSKGAALGFGITVLLALCLIIITAKTLQKKETPKETSRPKISRGSTILDYINVVPRTRSLITMYSFMGGGLFCAWVGTILLVVATATDHWMQYRLSGSFAHQGLWRYCLGSKCFLQTESIAYWNATRAFMILSALCATSGIIMGVLAFAQQSTFTSLSRPFSAGIMFFASTLFVLLALAIYTGVTVSFLGRRFGDWRFSWSYILGWVALLMTFFAGYIHVTQSFCILAALWSLVSMVFLILSYSPALSVPGRGPLVSTVMSFAAALSVIVAMAVYTSSRWSQTPSPQVQTSFAWSFYLGWVSSVLFLCAASCFLGMGVKRSLQTGGNLLNLLTSILTVLSTSTNYWIRQSGGHSGLWQECTHGICSNIPCQSETLTCPYTRPHSRAHPYPQLQLCPLPQAQIQLPSTTRALSPQPCVAALFLHVLIGPL
ncbi:Sialic acid-binding Ig-like lectin 10 [Cricetulus griseus]|nr:Sialic acid-binding Ig-like lectin 10 [Cricetulus griseus]